MKFAQVILSVMALSLLFLLALGCGGTGSPKDASPTHKIGEEMAYTEWKLVVLDVENRGNLMKASENPKKEAKAKGKFIQLHLKATNISDKGSGTQWNLDLVDAKDKVYSEWPGTTESMRSAFFPGGVLTKGLDFLGDAKPGQSVEGYAIFDIPADATGLKAKLSVGAGSNYVTKFVDLGL